MPHNRRSAHMIDFVSLSISYSARYGYVYSATLLGSVALSDIKVVPYRLDRTEQRTAESIHCNSDFEVHAYYLARVPPASCRCIPLNPVVFSAAKLVSP